MEQLKLPHRIVLMNHLSFNDKNYLTTYNLPQLVTLAIIAESSILGKLAIKNDTVEITDSKKTGHSMIDNIISEIQNSDKSQGLVFWIERLSEQLDSYEHVKNNLIDNQLIKSGYKRVLGIPVKKILVPQSKNIQSVVKNYLLQLSRKNNLSLRDFLTLEIISKTELNKLAGIHGNDQTLLQTMKTKPTFQYFSQPLDKIMEQANKT